jgi:hypothetical protein
MNTKITDLLSRRTIIAIIVLWIGTAIAIALVINWAMGGSPPVEALISVNIGIGMAILSLVITAIMNMFNLAMRIETRVMDKFSEMGNTLTRMGGVLTRIEELLKKR